MSKPFKICCHDINDINYGSGPATLGKQGFGTPAAPSTVCEGGSLETQVLGCSGCSGCSGRAASAFPHALRDLRAHAGARALL